ncbi:hypothetical protein ASG53_15010 [Sanguibacter sp. Leaf3]|nr:hypothetical protein ASG53_15010 [Sanguibacter sp. Leaf3]
MIGLGDTTVLDFWRWGMSELRTNTLRGVMAEFIVSRAVGSTAPGRVEWDPYDVVTPDGIRIEVKCGAYLQAWSQQRLSRIVFSGLSARLLDEAAGTYAGERGYNADVYVFAVQTATSHDVFDVLDTRQWEFYVLSRARVEGTGYRSLSLVTVRSLAATAVSVDQLAAEVSRVHADAQRPTQ